MTELVIIVTPYLVTGMLLGGMVFFAFVFAPLVFTKLPADTAGAFIRQVFPVYYRVFAAGSALAAVSAWGYWEAWILAAVAAGFTFAWLWLMPRINAARDESAQDRFGRLHRLSVIINAMQMIALFIVFIRLLAASIVPAG